MSSSRDRMTVYGLILLLNVVLNVGLSVAKYYMKNDDQKLDGGNSAQATETAAYTQAPAIDTLIPTETPVPTFTPTITPTPTLLFRQDNNPVLYGIDKKAEDGFSVFQETPVPVRGTIIQCNISYMDVIVNTGNGYEAGERAYGDVLIRDTQGVEHRLLYPANRCFMVGDKFEMSYHPFKDGEFLTNNQFVFITNMNGDNIVYNIETNYVIGEFMNLEGVIKLNGASQIAPGE